MRVRGISKSFHDVAELFSTARESYDVLECGPPPSVVKSANDNEHIGLQRQNHTKPKFGVLVHPLFDFTDLRMTVQGKQIAEYAGQFRHVFSEYPQPAKHLDLLV